MFQSIKPLTDDKHCNYQNERLICSNFKIKHNIKVKATELELLLVDFLSEALYLSDVNNEAYLDLEIHQLTDKNIEATLKGIKINGFDVVEIKAVTYHNLKIELKNDIWQADIVFDI